MITSVQEVLRFKSICKHYYYYIIILIATQFICGVDCVGATVCDNGQQEYEIHLILDLHPKIVTRNRCKLFVKDHSQPPCLIGTDHCVVNATTSTSDDSYIVKCTTNFAGQRVTSYPIYLNTTFSSCTG